MAAASYVTNLNNVITDMPNTTGWSLISSGGGGANALSAPETDDYVQGNNCISRNPWSNSIRGMVYNSAQTIAADNAVWIWWKADVAQALATKSAGGIQGLIGSGTGALNAWYLDGSDTYTFGGWKCVPIDPTVTPSTTIGNPTTTTSFFGVRWNIPATGPSKGDPFKIDAIRIGRSFTITAGDSTNGYATFAGASAISGSVANQYGQIQFTNGTYVIQGLLRLGTSTDLVDFRDSNRVINIANTEYVSSGFNGFEISNSNSIIDWTNISISALGTVSRGYIDILDNAVVNFTDCTFTDLDNFVFKSNSTITGTTFRRCNEIISDQAVLDGCIITRSTAAIAFIELSSSLNNLTNTTFISSGTGHAIEISSGTTHTLNNLTFTGYASTNGTTGNEAIYVNIATGTVTLNVSGGTVPSIRTAGAVVDVVASALVTLTGLQANSEVRAYVGTDPATSTEIAGTENSGTTFAFSQSVAGQSGYIQVFSIGYNPIYLELTYSGTDQEIPIQQITDRVYSNPVGA